MANKIIPKKSSVAGKQPLTSDLQIGEIAINLADKLIFTKDANGTIVTLGGDLSGYLTTSSAAATYQPKDADLTAIAALTGSSGFLKTNGAGTWSVDTAAYLALTGGTLSGNLTVGSNPSSNTSALNLGGYNSVGGTGYHGFLAVTNTYGSATNPNKFFRINSAGNLQIINSAYTATIFDLADDGTLSGVKISGNAITTGTVGTARLGSGTADSTTYLRGDGTWATVSAGGASSISASFTGTNAGNLISATMADNDYFRLRVGGTASNAGWVELATADDGNEPIYVRQYSGNFGTLVNELTLLDASGNTIIPQTLKLNKNGDGTNLYLGDDVMIGDVNVTNTFRVTGQQDATKGYIIFGNNDSKALGRSGAGDLTYDNNTVYHAGNISTVLSSYLTSATAASTYQTQSGMSSYLTTSAAATAYQPKDADLTAIAALTGTSGFLKTNGAGTWTVDTNTYLTSASSLDATKLTGTVPTASLGSGTASSSTYLRGDGTWATISFSPNVGTLTFTAANELAHFQSSVNSYNQVIIQNSNAGAAASADFVVTNNLGTDSTYYGNLGMNSSAFTGSGSFNLANAVYLSATSGDLVLGTTTANAIRFVTNNGSTDAVVISSAGAVSMTGNLTFSATGQRFLADFSNATLANRLWFQTSTANSSTSIFAVPSGTGNSSAWTAFNGSDPANAGLIQLFAGTGEHSIRVSANGTGTNLPLAFYIGGTKLFQMGASGQFGIGATPDYGTAGQVLMSGGASAAPTWGTPSASDSTKLPLAGGQMTGNIGMGIASSAWSGVVPRAIDFSGGGLVAANTGGSLYIGSNVYYNGTNWIYKTTGTVGLIDFSNTGSATFYKAVSGSAGATASLVSLLALDTNGNLTATANVTAYSDERKKTNWRDLPANFIEQLAQVKHGIYDRTDEDVTQVGVSAQSLRPVMPHAVLEGTDGFLSVAYGNAALTACVALANRVLALEAKIAALVD